MIEIKRYSNAQEKEWNDFVASSRNGTFLFNRGFMDYHADRFDDASVMAYRNGKLCALLPANRRESTLYSHQGLTYGSWVVPINHFDGAMMLEIWEAFMTYCKSEGIATIVYKSIPHIYSPYPSEDDLYALFRQGAVLKEVNLSSTIDLRNPIGFNMSKRQQLRKAHKCDITISETDDYERFWEILSACLAERHDSKPVHSIDEIRLLVSRFPDNIKLYAVSDDEGIQAGVCMFDTGHVFHSQYTATTAKARKNYYLTALYDYLINLGAGHAYFDFGISNEDHGAYLNEGLLNQKSSMGGQGVVYSIYEIKVK